MIDYDSSRESAIDMGEMMYRFIYEVKHISFILPTYQINRWLSNGRNSCNSTQLLTKTESSMMKNMRKIRESVKRLNLQTLLSN
jgi:hypothetical protein